MGILDVPVFTTARRAARTNRAGGNRIVAVGDSISYNNSGLLEMSLAQRTQQRATLSAWFATQGYTIEQIRDTHIPSVLALTGNQRPAACLILAGTNNTGADGGGGAGTGYNFASAKTSYQQITSRLVNGGILPIVCTLPPRTVTLANTNVRQFNAWLMAFAASSGFPLLDYHAALVSGSGGWVSGVTGDGTHPAGRGFRMMTTATAATLGALFPPGGPYLTRSTDDPQNLIPGGAKLFYGTPTSGVALGWVNYSGGSGQVFAVDATDTTIAGKWQSLSKPTAATTNAYLQLNPAVATGFSVGDRIAFSCLFQALNFEAQNDIQSTGISIDFRNSGGSIISSLNAVQSSIGDFPTTCTAYAEGVVPAGTTAISIGLIVGGAAVTTDGATLRVAQPGIINLTTLGLA